MSVEKIAPQDWMTNAQTSAVIAALQAGGFSARFVGGCVRDTLLGRPIRDIDIATDAAPDSIVNCLESSNLRAIPTGIDHGTVTAVSGGSSFEITTLRRDVETDGRHAKVEFTDDWDDDAARRDLTINAISLEIDGTLHDPFGGQADLVAGRIRFVGNAGDRIAEDVLRLLRYFRFYAHYGYPPPDEEALAACRSMASYLPSLSGERVRTELVKLLEAPDPLPTLKLMLGTHVLERILPEARELECLSRLVGIEAANNIDIDPIRRLGALLNADKRGSEDVSGRLRLSNAERNFLSMLAKDVDSIPQNVVERRRLVYRLGAPSVRELVLIGWARDSRTTRDDGWRDFLHEIDAWSPKKFPVTGSDVLERGVDAGPGVGDFLRIVEIWWVDGNFTASRKECLSRLDQEIGKYR